MIQRLIIYIILVLAPFCFPKNLSAKECNLTFGAVPQFEHRKLFLIWDEILKKIGMKLNCHIQFIPTKSISHFEEYLREGKYDIAYVNAYESIRAYKVQGYNSIIRSGAKGLQGILVVKKGGAIKSIKDLDGKIIAFPSPFALGASALLRSELEAKYKISFVPKYVRTHSSVYLHVAKGFSLAGGGVNRTLNEQKTNLRNKLKIIYKTAIIPAHPIIIHPRIGPAISIKIQKAILEIAKETPYLMKKIPMNNPIKSTNKDYEIIHKLNLDKYMKKVK